MNLIEGINLFDQDRRFMFDIQMFRLKLGMQIIEGGSSRIDDPRAVQRSCGSGSAPRTSDLFMGDGINFAILEALAYLLLREWT